MQKRCVERGQEQSDGFRGGCLASIAMKPVPIDPAIKWQVRTAPKAFIAWDSFLKTSSGVYLILSYLGTKIKAARVEKANSYGKVFI